MKIFVNGRFLRVARPTGTQRSAARWLEAVAPHLNSLSVYVPEGAESRGETRRWQVERLPGSGRWDHLWEQFIYPRISRDGVLWTLMGTGPVRHRGSKHVMMMHDINFMLIPTAFSPSFRAWYHFACAEAAKKADLIVCFTEYVKLTLVERLQIDGARIKVIPQGPGIRGIESINARGRSHLENPYFLCVGSLQPHKNLSLILSAWARFHETRPDFRLKVVGRKQSRFSKLDIELSDALPGVEFTGYINDDELVRLYGGAVAFIYPSTEEGFGLPIVEAFYCGCPVITSNNSCLPEVAGNAALFVDPRGEGELLSAMQRITDDNSERERLILAGSVRRKLFKWERAGREMAGVLGSVGNG